MSAEAVAAVRRRERPDRFDRPSRVREPGGVDRSVPVGRGLVRRVRRAGRLAASCIVLWMPLAGTDALAHEYWLDPLSANVRVGDLLAANVRNGEEFAGSAFPYDPNRMERLELVGSDGAVPIVARLGDFPAVQVTLEAPGTHLVVLDTFGKGLVYEELAKFAGFLDYHGQDGVLDAHAERGLPETSIRERYYRHVKMLVRAAGPPAASGGAVSTDPTGGAEAGGSSGVDRSGDGVDAVDSPVFSTRGQALELVPENDPYAGDELRVRLLADGEPLQGAQVELFERRPTRAVSRTLARTDGEGRARFDVARVGDYLVNAVHVTAPADDALAGENEPPHWQSRWASLTFEKR